MSLANNTVVILGGSSGIGLATAKAAKAEGSRIVITGRSPERLQTAKAVLGGDVKAVALDVVDEAGTRALFSELERVDHVFITAGAVLFDPKLATGSESVRPSLDTRFWGPSTPPNLLRPKLAPAAR
jgi:NADP-dependent 3-hydroxy acid dehydrogenase YdfG